MRSVDDSIVQLIITCNSITDNSIMPCNFSQAISIIQIQLCKIHSCNLNHTTQDFNYNDLQFLYVNQLFQSRNVQSIVMCGLSDNVDHTIFVLELGYPLELRRSHRSDAKQRTSGIAYAIYWVTGHTNSGSRTLNVF